MAQEPKDVLVRMHEELQPDLILLDLSMPALGGVETYRARGMEKLGLRSRAALVKFALQEGLMKKE